MNLGDTLQPTTWVKLNCLFFVLFSANAGGWEKLVQVS